MSNVLFIYKGRGGKGLSSDTPPLIKSSARPCHKTVLNVYCTLYFLVYKWQTHCGKKDGSLQIGTPCRYMIPSSYISSLEPQESQMSLLENVYKISFR